MVTDWDALGYYIYLPAIFIYEDVTKLNWFSDIDKRYSVSGGQFYQVRKHDNGNYVFKYLGGVSIIQSPFFFLGHFMAKITGYKQDGFSLPYQYAIAFSVIFYCLLAVFLLRKLMLIYFDDFTIAITLLLLLLASNFIQYVSIKSGMSHGFIFPLYVLVLFTTIKWHQTPSIGMASLTGLVIGLAMICRPTEAIMLFIPLLWNTQNKELAKEKWRLVKQYKKHVGYAILFGFIGILPQLIYWKIASGSFVYDVGSKWSFLSPNWQVLFGWEKGWFIYTPITVFFVLGLSYIKNYPFKKSVITFCLLNIYIIISWYEWRYGASYSCRALVQSYGVFALPFAAFIQQIASKKWRFMFYAIGCYLVFVNLFQIWQYNKGILHYDHMNRMYYGSIYLDPNPSPLDMSLLDTDEQLNNEEDYNKEILIQSDKSIIIDIGEHSSAFLADKMIQYQSIKNKSDLWIKVEATIKANKGLWGSYINSELQIGDSLMHKKFRLFNAISQENNANEYAFYLRMPDSQDQCSFNLYISSRYSFEGIVEHITVTLLNKN